MNISVHSPNPSKTISWASGTSTELFIYPPDGNFQTRTFDFRISTATVEVEETNFSDFSGLTRILLILNGNLSLNHEGKYSKELKTFDQDRFDGSWKTKSIGKVTDFNVMFTKKYDSKVNHLPFHSNEKTDLEITSKFHYFFVNNGKFEINDHIASAGDLVEIQTSFPEKVSICCLESGNIIESIIELKQ